MIIIKYSINIIYHLCLAIVFLAAIWLLWLAVPRALAAIDRAPYEWSLAGLALGRGAEEGRLNSAARAYEDSLEHHIDSRTMSNLAAIRMRIAKQEGYRTSRGAKMLDLAQKADRQALRRSPLLTRSWSRLALAMMVDDSLNPKIPELLTLAVATAPDNNSVKQIRLFAAMMAWDKLDIEQRRVVGQQIEYAAQMSMIDLANTAKRFNRIGAVREALSVEPVLLRRFDAEISRRIIR